MMRLGADRQPVLMHQTPHKTDHAAIIVSLVGTWSYVYPVVYVLLLRQSANFTARREPVIFGERGPLVAIIGFYHLGVDRRNDYDECSTETMG